NREVMAVPGSPLEPRCAGNNRLLRQGAILVRNAEDIVEALGTQTSRHMKAPDLPSFDTFDDPEADLPSSQIEAVRNVLSPTPLPIDEIARAAQIGVQRCAAIVVELELAGDATTHAGGLVSIAL
ncbi:MAG: DNA-protecting protein DprA, partial [Pseudomonadota bacterium]